MPHESVEFANEFRREPNAGIMFDNISGTPVSDGEQCNFTITILTHSGQGVAGFHTKLRTLTICFLLLWWERFAAGTTGTLFRSNAMPDVD